MRKLEELQIVPKLRRRELKVSQPGPIPKLSEAVFPPRLAQLILQTVHPAYWGRKPAKNMMTSRTIATMILFFMTSSSF